MRNLRFHLKLYRRRNMTTGKLSEIRFTQTNVFKHQAISHAIWPLELAHFCTERGNVSRGKSEVRSASHWLAINSLRQPR